MVEITEKKIIRLTSFILSKSGILNSLFENFANNENITFNEESNIMRITCNFIRNFIECNARKQGNIYYIGYLTLLPTDNLEIFEDCIINMGDIKRMVILLNNRLDDQYGQKYNLKIVL